MPLRTPEDFSAEKNRVFEKAPVNRGSIQGWVNLAQAKIQDSANTQISTSTRLGAAYDAMLDLSLAVLNSKGWRVTSAPGHHAQTLEAACAYAGAGDSLFETIDAILDLRNMHYQAKAPAPADLESALDALGKLAPLLLAELSAFLK